MSKIEKLTKKLFSETSDNNFDFDDLRKIIMHFGFEEEIRGSHHTFRIKEHSAFMNIQPLTGNKAKPYQVKQARRTLRKYFL